MRDNNTYLAGFFAGRHLRAGAQSASVLVSPDERQDFFNGLACGLVESDVKAGHHVMDFWEWINVYSAGTFPLSLEDYLSDETTVNENNSHYEEHGTDIYPLGPFVVNNDVPFIYPAAGAGAAVDKRNSFSSAVTNAADGSWSSSSEATEDIPKSPSWKTMCLTIASQAVRLKPGECTLSISNASWETDEFAFYHTKSMSCFRLGDSYDYSGGFQLNSSWDIRPTMSFNLLQDWYDPQDGDDFIFCPFIAIGTSQPKPAGTIQTASSGPASITNEWVFYGPPPAPLKFGPLARKSDGTGIFSFSVFRFDLPNERIGQFLEFRSGISFWRSIRSLSFSYRPTDGAFQYLIRDSDNKRHSILFYPGYVACINDGQETRRFYYPASYFPETN